MTFIGPLTTINKAQKNHICDWCGEKILTGESYQKWCYIDCGEAETVKAHPECFEASYLSDNPEETYFNRDHQKGVFDDH